MRSDIRLLGVIGARIWSPSVLRKDSRLLFAITWCCPTAVARSTLLFRLLCSIIFPVVQEGGTPFQRSFELFALAGRPLSTHGHWNRYKVQRLESTADGVDRTRFLCLQGEESRRSFPSQDILVPWHHQRNEADANSDNGPTTESAATTSNSDVFQRYCHVFAKGELEGLMQEVAVVEINQSYYDTSNWCIVATKLADK
eukprot:m.449296 g.449296  ORF g.449296 m.449296 type:complete len:199 (+) comp56900_c0_seq8:963-1559(+)